MVASAPHLFFSNDTTTTEIYTLSLHDALPILRRQPAGADRSDVERGTHARLLEHQRRRSRRRAEDRSEEHTSELQSQSNLVCRLLLEKKKKPCMIRRKAFLGSTAPRSISRYCI